MIFTEMKKANYSQISRVPSCTRPPMCLGLVTDRRLFLWQMSRVRGADQRMSAKHRDKQNIARIANAVQCHN